ncbi:MAG: hypothetical protein ABI702_12275 [Burkholderiales bacterium]
MTPHDDPARDPWLSEALRHAPDAGALPPAELSETILRQARNAVKTAPVHAPAHPLMRLWSWLARPPVAAGFATLTLATLIGVMWWDKPLDDTLPRPDAPAAASENTVAEPVPAPAATAAPQAAAPARDELKAAAPAKKETPRVAAKPSPAAPPPPPKSDLASGERARTADTAAPVDTPPAAPPAPARESSAEPRVAAAPAQALGKAAPAGGLALRRLEADTTTPLAEPPERWTWQRGGGMQAMTPALQRWLAQLDRAARWHPADTAPPAAADGTVLQLSRDGTPYATIQLGDDAAWLMRVGSPPLTASLPPATAAALKAALLDAAP